MNVRVDWFRDERDNLYPTLTIAPMAYDGEDHPSNVIAVYAGKEMNEDTFLFVLSADEDGNIKMYPSKGMEVRRDDATDD